MGNEIIKKDSGHICTLSFNRPEKKNALNSNALLTLGTIIKEIEKDDNIRVIVLRGAGDKTFSSGVDLAGDNESFKSTIESLTFCLNALIDCSKPVISMIYGYAIGAGLDIAVISDMRIAEQKAQFAAPLVRLGRIYYFKAIERLTRLIGLGPAKEMLLTGKQMSSQWAEKVGLVNQIVSSGQLENTTYSIADEFACETAPLAVKLTKLTIKKLFEESRLENETEKKLNSMLETINNSFDATEGIMAKLEKRNPQFKGR